MGQTKFIEIFDCFLGKITDDMYMELNEQDTKDMLIPLLKGSLPYFEFPRVNILNFDENQETYLIDLTFEEINIIATYMIVEWLNAQIATVENIRMKYSGSDFKFTSQANHIDKLLEMKESYIKEGYHLQRLYKRRKADENGIYKSTFGEIMKSSNRRK